MPQPRKNIVSIEDTPYYHCIGRCVRHAFLCGKDKFSGKDYEHRKQWVVDRLNLLSSAVADAKISARCSVTKTLAII